MCALALWAAAPSPAAGADPASVHPGVGIVELDETGRQMDCTLGFILKTASHGPVAFSAGHCAMSLGSGIDETVWLDSAAGGAGLTPIGYWRRRVFSGTSSQDGTDIAAMGLNPARMPVDPRAGGTVPLVDYLPASALRSGDVLCYFSAKRSRVCDPVVEVHASTNKVILSGAAIAGESGSGVFSQRSDGTADMVGILDSERDYYDGGPSTISVELVAPWIERYGLTLY